MVIGAVLVFDHRLTLETVEDLVRNKLVRHRRFRQHVVETSRRFGRPRWRDDPTFDLRAHVRKLQLREPADAAALAGLASERMSAPLPRDHSPWSFDLHGSRARGVRASRADPPLHRGRAGAGGAPRTAGGRGARESGQGATPVHDDRRGRVDAEGWLRQLTGCSDSSRCRVIPRACCAVLSTATSASLGRNRSPRRRQVDRAGTRHHVTDVLLAGVRARSIATCGTRAATARHPRALSGGAAVEVVTDGVGNHYASVFVRLPIAVADPRARVEAIARDMTACGHGVSRERRSDLTRLAGIRRARASNVGRCAGGRDGRAWW